MDELPRLATLVHGSTLGMAKMVSAFVESVPAAVAAASKAQVKTQIQHVATQVRKPGGGGTCSDRRCVVLETRSST